MKIVAYSNHDTETVNEKLIAENLKQADAETKCAALNVRVTDADTYYYKVVSDDYKLYKWEP